MKLKRLLTMKNLEHNPLEDYELQEGQELNKNN